MGVPAPCDKFKVVRPVIPGTSVAVVDFKIRRDGTDQGQPDDPVSADSTPAVKLDETVSSGQWVLGATASTPDRARLIDPERALCKLL